MAKRMQVKISPKAGLALYLKRKTRGMRNPIAVFINSNTKLPVPELLELLTNPEVRFYAAMDDQNVPMKLVAPIEPVGRKNNKITWTTTWGNGTSGRLINAKMYAGLPLREKILNIKRFVFPIHKFTTDSLSMTWTWEITDESINRGKS